jgi:hypothetical protein
MTDGTLTESQFLSMISELFDRSKESALKSAHELWNSGAIEPENYENNYRLPKMFMTVYSSTMKGQYAPLGGWGNKEKKEIRNMEHFV